MARTGVRAEATVHVVTTTRSRFRPAVDRADTDTRLLDQFGAATKADTTPNATAYQQLGAAAAANAVSVTRPTGRGVTPSR